LRGPGGGASYKRAIELANRSLRAKPNAHLHVSCARGSRSGNSGAGRCAHKTVLSELLRLEPGSTITPIPWKTPVHQAVIDGLWGDWPKNWYDAVVRERRACAKIAINRKGDHEYDGFLSRKPQEQPPGAAGADGAGACRRGWELRCRIRRRVRGRRWFRLVTDYQSCCALVGMAGAGRSPMPAEFGKDEAKSCRRGALGTRRDHRPSRLFVLAAFQHARRDVSQLQATAKRL